MEKSKKIKMYIIMGILGFSLTYGLIIPAKIKSDIPGMKEYLKDQGFSKVEYIKYNILTRDVTFNTNEGEKKIRYSRNGLFQMVY